MKYILIACLFLTGCGAVPRDKALSLLEAEGCSSIILGSYEWIFDGCGKEDSYNISFSCIRNGRSVSGVICGGILKSYTVRYN